MKRKETNKKETMIELLKENNFHSSMAAQKAGHAGLLVMAAYLVIRKAIDGEEDKISNFIFMVSILLFISDDIENIIYSVKKLIKH